MKDGVKTITLIWMLCHFQYVKNVTKRSWKLSQYILHDKRGFFDNGLLKICMIPKEIYIRFGLKFYNVKVFI